MIKKLPRSLMLLQTKYTSHAAFVCRVRNWTTTILTYPNKQLTPHGLLIDFCGTVIVIETGNKAEKQLTKFGEDKKMKKNILRGWIPTTGLVLAMAFNTFANGGIIIPTFTSSDVKGQCVAVDSGIIIPTFASNIIGMLVSDFGGIIIPTLVGKTTDRCETKK